MDLIVATIAIAFVPLLEKICDMLGIDKPAYRRPAAWLNIVEVLIQIKAIPTHHLFHGDDGPTLQDSAESAAMKATIFLVRRFKIMVVDVNLDLRAKHERATQFFACKRDWFSKLDQDIYEVPNYEITPTDGIDYNLYRVEINFLELLTTVVKKYAIPVTPVDVMQFRQGIYVASMTVFVPGSVCIGRTFMGYETDTIDAAKQTLAKEVLSFLASIYRFEVMDVNYHFLKVEAAILRAERNNYIRIKQRVYGLKEEQEPTPQVIQEDQMTPKGKRARIEMPAEAPPPSKKPHLEHTSSSARTMISDAVITPDLKFPERRARND